MSLEIEHKFLVNTALWHAPENGVKCKYSEPPFGGVSEVAQNILHFAEEMARRVRLAFKQMPEESSLIVFAKVMTSDVPHEMKVAVWDAVRYSHIWWLVDEVLKGDVMENPIVQCAEDFNGNNLLWYLTYRDDQQAEGGFACPKLAKTLIDLGVDPNHRNKLGLSWNDVAWHVNRPEDK